MFVMFSGKKFKVVKFKVKSGLGKVKVVNEKVKSNKFVKCVCVM